MVDVVERGTARIAKIKNINIAGKTGTVENFILIEGEKKQHGKRSKNYQRHCD